MSCPHCKNGIVDLLFTSRPCEHCQTVAVDTETTGLEPVGMLAINVEPKLGKSFTAYQGENRIHRRGYPVKHEKADDRVPPVFTIKHDRTDSTQWQEHVRHAAFQSRRTLSVYRLPCEILFPDGREPEMLSATMISEIIENGPSTVRVRWNSEDDTLTAEDGLVRLKGAQCLQLPMIRATIHFDSDEQRQAYDAKRSMQMIELIKRQKSAIGQVARFAAVLRETVDA